MVSHILSFIFLVLLSSHALASNINWAAGPWTVKAANAPSGTSGIQNWPKSAHEFKIERVPVKGRFVDVVTIPGGSFQLPELPLEKKEKAAFEALSAEEKQLVRENAKEFLHLAMSAYYQGAWNGTTVVNSVGFYQLEIGQHGLNPVRDLIEDVSHLPENSTEASRKAAMYQRAKSMVLFLWKATFGSWLETQRAFKVLSRTVKNAQTEQGFEFVFKPLFQFGIGSYGFTLNRPVLIAFGFNEETRSYVMRFSTRREKHSAGMAFSAGMRFEIRRYQRSNSLQQDRENSNHQGSTLYPPSIPAFGIVRDEAPGYTSIGVSLGPDVSEIIPGWSLASNVTAFEENQKVYHLFPRPARVGEKLQDRVREKGGAISPPQAPAVPKRSPGQLCKDSLNNKSA